MGGRGEGGQAGRTYLVRRTSIDGDDARGVGMEDESALCALATEALGLAAHDPGVGVEIIHYLGRGGREGGREGGKEGRVTALAPDV